MSIPQKQFAGLDWRESFLICALIGSLWLLFITEILSTFSALSFFPVLIAWILFLLILIFTGAAYLRSHPFAWPTLKASGIERIYFAGICFYVAAIAIIAIQTPPNNWDAMSYHMTRVANWIQNKNVNFFATGDLRQLNYPPLSEYYILHLQILGQSDQWANLIQTFSLVGSLLCVSLLAKHFGAGLRGQLIACVIAVTLPIGILEGSSTQNDYVACFWILSTVYFLLSHKESLKPLHLICAGISLGLGLLTKGATYIYSTPFLLAYAFIPFRPFNGRFIKNALAVLIIALSINSAHYLRNYDLCQSPLSCKDMVNLTFNEDMSPALLTSNSIRSVALNLGTPFKASNDFLLSLVQSSHEFLGLQPDDARVTYDLESFKVGRYIFHEDYASNPLHTILLILFLPLIFIFPLPQKLKFFTLNVLFAVILLNVMLKWNPWLVRFYLTPFILLSIPLGLVLSSWKNQKVANLLIVIFLITSSWWLFNNQTKPFFGKNNIFNTPRHDQYFSARPTHKDSYVQASEFIKDSHCTNLGLRLNPFAWQYPLWAALNSPASNYRLEAVDLINPSEKYADTDFDPCLVIDNLFHDKEIIIVGNKKYRLAKKLDVLKVYAPLP